MIRSAPSLLYKRSRKLLDLLFSLAVSILIAAAIWAAAAAIVENIRYGKATDQILEILADGRALAARDPGFAQQPADDVVARLTSAGLLLKPAGDSINLQNPWQHTLSLQTVQASRLRIDNLVPAQDCRRLAHFFMANFKEIGLKALLAHPPTAAAPQPFFDDTQPAATVEAVATACGQEPLAYLTLDFSLR